MVMSQLINDTTAVTAQLQHSYSTVTYTSKNFCEIYFCVKNFWGHRDPKIYKFLKIMAVIYLQCYQYQIQLFENRKMKSFQNNTHFITNMYLQ